MHQNWKKNYENFLIGPTLYGLGRKLRIGPKFIHLMHKEITRLLNSETKFKTNLTLNHE